jgi:hypothetical protein
MKKPISMAALEKLGRVRLSKSFFMREFLYSEIANLHAMPNIPDDPDLAIEAGTRLCEDLLEPLQDRFGRIAIRSAYRTPEVNGFGNRHNYSCARNESTWADHIWDPRPSALFAHLFLPDPGRLQHTLARGSGAPHRLLHRS